VKAYSPLNTHRVCVYFQVNGWSGGISVFVNFLGHSSISVNATVDYSSLASSIGTYKIVLLIQQSCQFPSFQSDGAFVFCELDPL
jgi:hypothetical protein